MGMRLQLYCDYFENSNITISQWDMLSNLGFIQCFWDATAHGPWVFRFIAHNYDEKVCEHTLLTVKALPVLNSTHGPQGSFPV